MEYRVIADSFINNTFVKAGAIVSNIIGKPGSTLEPMEPMEQEEAKGRGRGRKAEADAEAE